MISSPVSLGLMTLVIEILAWAKYLVNRLEAIELRTRELIRGVAQ